MSDNVFRRLDEESAADGYSRSLDNRLAALAGQFMSTVTRLSEVASAAAGGSEPDPLDVQVRHQWAEIEALRNGLANQNGRIGRLTRSTDRRYEEQSAVIDGIQTNMDGILENIETLTGLVAELQGTRLSPAEEAAVDEFVANLEEIDKTKDPAPSVGRFMLIEVHLPEHLADPERVFDRIVEMTSEKLGWMGQTEGFLTRVAQVYPGDVVGQE